MNIDYTVEDTDNGRRFSRTIYNVDENISLKELVAILSAKLADSGEQLVSIDL